MALRAFVRSRVMTATPLSWTVPLTNSSEAITANLRNDTNGVDLEDNFKLYEWDLKKEVERRAENDDDDDDRDKLIRREAVNKLGMIDLQKCLSRTLSPLKVQWKRINWISSLF